MIRIQTVAGNVIVDDVKSGLRQMARSGMELDDRGNYLIATAEKSSAEIIAPNGQSISLKEKSFLRIRGDRTWLERHTIQWNRDMRTFCGRLWSRIAGDGRDPGDSGPSGGGGVRG